MSETTLTTSDSMAEVIQKLRGWIMSQRPELTDVDEDVDIIESRLIDSLAFVSFLLFIEELRGRELSADEIKLDHFRTLRTIGERLFSRAPAPPPAARWSFLGKRR